MIIKYINIPFDNPMPNNNLLLNKVAITFTIIGCFVFIIRKFSRGNINISGGGNHKIIYGVSNENSNNIYNNGTKYNNDHNKK